MSLRALDAVLLNQCLISGQITDAITESRISTSPAIRLDWKADSSHEYKQLPKIPLIKPDGYYAFLGAPTQFFPALQEDETLHCRLTVSAEGYQELNTEFVLTPSDLGLSTVTEHHAGFEVKIRRLNAPLALMNIALSPQPVSLAGRVIEDHDLNTLIAGASVTITNPEGAGETVTDSSGYFRLEELPVVKRVTVKVEHGGHTTTQEVLLDYRSRINERIFSLSA